MAPSSTRKQVLPSFAGFCVYVHRRATDGQVFYVGLGRRARVRQKASRNPSWVAVVAEHGYTYEVIEMFDTAAEAAAREVALIREYIKLGAPLVNRTQGGEGAARWVTPAPDPIADYKAIGSRMKQLNAIERWREVKLCEYGLWLRKFNARRTAAARAHEAERQAMYRASLR